MLESDLLEILLTQVEDKKLSFWVIVLISMLTNAPGEMAAQDDKDALNKANREYKKSFLRKEVLHTLIIHLSDVFKA